MSEGTLPKGHVERLTAVERDVEALGTGLSALREETQQSFRESSRKSEENFNRLWDHQGVIGDKIEKLGSQLQTDTEQISEKVASGKQVNWNLAIAAVLLLTTLCGATIGAIVSYVNEKDKHAREREELRDEINFWRTKSMIRGDDEDGKK